MTPFEHLLDLSTERKFGDGLSPEELTATVQSLERSAARDAAIIELNRIRRAELAALHRSLTLADAQHLAEEAMTHFDERDYFTLNLLTCLTCNVPGALATIQEQLLARNETWAEGILYRDAPPDIRDQLLARIALSSTDDRQREEWLCALAWIDDATVHQQFAQWRKQPPPWENSHFPTSRYASFGGWELDAHDQRRALTLPACYQLIPLAEATPAQIPGPVQVIAPLTETCHWCQNTLIAALDIDLQDARMQRLGIAGERLRLAMCPHCSPQESEAGLAFDFDLLGTCGWSATNSPECPDDITMYDDGDALHLPERQLVLGNERHTPLEAYATYWSPGISQIGGFPEWVQYADYPSCPMCRQTMIFVGQIEPLDLDGGEGVCYFLACFACGKSTVGFQQT